MTMMRATTARESTLAAGDRNTGRSQRRAEGSMKAAVFTLLLSGAMVAALFLPMSTRCALAADEGASATTCANDRRTAESGALIQAKQKELRSAVTEYNKWHPIMIDILTRENLVKLFEAKLLQRPLSEYESFISSGSLDTLRGVIVPPVPALPRRPGSSTGVATPSAPIAHPAR